MLPSEIVLSEQQEEAVESLFSFLRNPNENHITIQGYAGTGKTTMIQRFMQRLFERHRPKTLMTAPTNSAVNVLSGFGKEVGLTLPSKTIYSSLGLVLDSNDEVKRCTRSTDGDFNSHQIVVVDECSMLNQQVMNEIFNRTHSRQKIIFMGDKYQLNPVNEDISSSFTIKNQVKLTQVRRQDEGALLDCVSEVRQQCIDGTHPRPIKTRLDDNGDGVHFYGGSSFFELALAQYDTPEFEKDFNHCRVLAWTNKEVLRFNKLARKRLYGDDAPMFLVNEPVTTLNPILNEFDELVFATNDIMRIHSCDEMMYTDFLDKQERQYKVFRVVLEGYGQMASVIVLHPQSTAKFNARCNELAAECYQGKSSWSKFWSFKEQFCDLRHIYATTVHRAQGMTIENTFVNVSDLFKNQDDEELRRLLYVACSRASKNLVVNHDFLAI